MAQDPRKDSPGPVKLISNVVEKTVDKLSKSVQGTASTSSTSTSPKRVFSISRRPKMGQGASASSTSPTSSDSARTARPARAPVAFSTYEDSPFIRPPSPPSRPSLTPFRGDQSIRAGTQTLIQALQALPWMNSENEDEGCPSPESESEEDERPRLKHLSSSIHTIHRPLARPLRHTIPIRSPNPARNSSSTEDGTLGEGDSDSDGDIGQDFEENPDTTDPALRHSESITASSSQGTATNPLEAMRDRSTSVATIRLHRRTRLAEKLKQVFELDDIQQVLAEMPCWLLRSVLLQGYMYLTNSYLCFFAHMPSREDQILKSGSLNKKAQRTKRWIKHWFILKNDALSWYQSSSDPYFPHGIVDLRYAVSCEPSGDKGFRLRTNTRTVTLSADSVPSREEWVKAIRKVIFKAQNSGDSVKIAIPYSSILDVERSRAMDFSETIEVKIVDKGDQFSMDSYFFAYFHDMAGALDQIRDAVRTYRSQHNFQDKRMVALLDTTVSRSTSERTAAPETPTSRTSGFRLSSLLRPFSDTLSVARSSSSTIPSTPTPGPPVNVEAPRDAAQAEEYTHVLKKTDSSFVPFTASPTALSQAELLEPPQKQSKSLPLEHTYPPSVSNSSHFPDSSLLRSDNSGSWGWLRTRKVFGGLTSSDPPPPPYVSSPVKEIYSPGVPSDSPGPASRSSGFGDMAFSILETPTMAPDQETAEKFRMAFAYDEREKLLGYFSGYIYRLLPVFGKLYISTNYFCFKSSGPLAARTRMTLPIRDILACEKSKPTRFGHYGLIIIVKGHEEIFFEFNAEDKRDSFVRLLERQVEDVRKRLASGESVEPSSGKREALILEEFETQTTGSTDSDPAAPLTDAMADSLPAVMFTSASSTFLTFKPKKSLHFTFLTIGSRGDVQPYIALAKGLIADGHRCKIATHAEFKEWIESHGIEYGYTGGDPAELMRICVENGTFTVAFLKEGLLKFRGWLDDLLKTSWEACQDTDVLVESPSAMGGYHIAEALGIPYFRAFTMTWSRTRAYPHAFAVPERKMGGSYNYMSYVMFDQVFWRATASQINRWRRNVLHLPATNLDRMEPHKIPFLYNFSPHVVPPPLDWPEWIRVTGYWFLEDADVSAKKWAPPPSLLEFLDKARNGNHRVVYIGFGSIVVSDPEEMTRIVIEAVEKSGVWAILSKGWSDRLQKPDATEPEEPLPPQIYPIPSIPHDWLFQRIDAACHHGGAGTTGASLRAGIPTIIRPFFGDQFFWADRVEALGVGSGVRKLTVNALTEALLAATTDQKQIERAKTLGEHIRAENGVSVAIESIYRDLEYARSLIKQPDPDRADETEEHEGSTIRNQHHVHAGTSPGSGSGLSESGSLHGSHSEDWTMISDVDDRRSSTGSRLSSDARNTNKRTSFAAAVMSVLPESLAPSSPRRATP